MRQHLPPAPTASTTPPASTPVLALVFALVLIGVSLGCEQLPMALTLPFPKVAERHTSPTLTEAMGPILAEALVVQRAAGQPLPDDAETPEYLVEVLGLIRLQYPDAFLVTAEQEERFGAGVFDDDANEKTLLTTIRTLNRNRATPDTFVGHLVEQYKSSGLAGVRLEIAARLLTEQLKANRFVP